MDSTDKQPASHLIDTASRLHQVAVGLSILLGVLVSILPEQYTVLIVVLAVGLSFAAMVVSRSTRRLGLVVLIAFVPLTGILKAITGTRFAPLLFDLGILFASVLHFVDGFLQRKNKIDLLDVMLVALWALAFIQMFNPNVPSLTAGIEGFHKFVFMSVAYYVGRRILHERDIQRFQILIIVLSVPIAVYGIKQFFAPSALDFRMIELASASEITYLMGGQLRSFSTLPGPFHLGLYLLVSLLLVIRWMMDTSAKPRRPVLLLLILGIELIALFLTRTKSNWVGLAVGIMVLVLLQRRRLFRNIRRLAVVVLVGGTAIALLLATAPASSTKVLQDAIDAFLNPSEAPTIQFRLELWQETIIPAILKNPLIGYGTSSAGEGLDVLYTNTSSQYFVSHNLFFKVILETGVLGLALFALILGASMYRGYVRLRTLEPAQANENEILQWSMAVVVAFLIAGLTGAVLDAYPPNYYFWLVLGILSRPNLK